MNRRGKIYLETTDVPAERTVGEISALLVQAKAREITQVYGQTQRIEGVKFLLQVAPGVQRMFQLPARVDPVFKILRERKSGSISDVDRSKLREKAERIAWRQLFRWCQAQLCMIEIGMVEAPEVFLPYAVDDKGKSVYALFIESAQKQLPAKTGGS